MTLRDLLNDIEEIKSAFPSAMDMNVVLTNHQRDITHPIEMADIINHGKQEICLIVDIDLSEESYCDKCDCKVSECFCDLEYIDGKARE